MAKIIKIASTTSTPRIANQFRTSRNSSTNPFKYQNFEGNTLDVSAFADVFESSAPKETNKMKLIASSVAGSMHKIKTGITEPIVNFVKKVHSGISSAWDYAKNTNVSDLGAVKGFCEMMNKPIELPGSKALDNAIGSIKNGIGIMNEHVVGFGKGLGSKWEALVSGLHGYNKISADLSVSELEELWKSEISASKLEEVA